MAIPRKPSPLPTGRWNYVPPVIVMVPSEPQLVKNQTRITGMDNQISALYARG